jgi:chromosome condensin MukBEF MukE localization factor
MDNLIIQTVKKLIIDKLENDPEMKLIALNILKEQAKILNLEEKRVSGEEVAKHLKCKVPTLAKYRKNGMPYYFGKPNTYLLSECIAWYEKEMKIYRKTYLK